MLAYADNRAPARQPAREDNGRRARSERIRQGYLKAKAKHPKIIANLAQ